MSRCVEPTVIASSALPGSLIVSDIPAATVPRNALFAYPYPNCVSYDPTFAHEFAVILQQGLKRMVENQENVWYYITVMNENYPQPGLKKGQEEGILRGIYRLRVCQCEVTNETN